MDELDTALLDPGFTPGARRVPELLTKLAAAEPSDRARIEQAILRVQTPFVSRNCAAILALADEVAKPLLRGLAGRAAVLAAEREATAALFVEIVRSDRSALKLAAIRGLARLGGAARAPLEQARAGALGPLGERELREVQIGLAALGDDAAAAALPRGASNESDAVAARGARARLIGKRDKLRSAGPSSVALDVPLGRGAAVSLTCRAGLEPVLADELAARGIAGRARRGRVELAWDGPLAPLTSLRVALGVELVFERARVARESDVEATLALIEGREVRGRVGALTQGPVRFRLAWADAKKRRSATWAVAEGSSIDGGAAWINDPQDSTWTFTVDLAASPQRLAAAPSLEDARFAYRVADVPAASHPTVAAALARVGEARPGDVAWDPFVGSGLELCERAVLGPYASLWGSDRDVEALERSRRNLTSLGAGPFELVRGDAREVRVPGLTLVLSNPPMGRRVLRGHDLGALLHDTVANAARQLAAGGRIVLLSPAPRATAQAAADAGLVTKLEREVDLGGFHATLQRFDREA